MITVHLSAVGHRTFHDLESAEKWARAQIRRRDHSNYCDPAMGEEGRKRARKKGCADEVIAGILASASDLLSSHEIAEQAGCARKTALNVLRRMKAAGQAQNYPAAISTMPKLWGRV